METFHSTYTNAMAKIPPVMSMEITIGLNVLAFTLPCGYRNTYDFHSKYAPPPETGTKMRMSPIEAVLTPQ